MRGSQSARTHNERHTYASTLPPPPLPRAALTLPRTVLFSSAGEESLSARSTRRLQPPSATAASAPPPIAKWIHSIMGSNPPAEARQPEELVRSIQDSCFEARREQFERIATAATTMEHKQQHSFADEAGAHFPALIPSRRVPTTSPTTRSASVAPVDPAAAASLQVAQQTIHALRTELDMLKRQMAHVAAVDASYEELQSENQQLKALKPLLNEQIAKMQAWKQIQQERKQKYLADQSAAQSQLEDYATNYAALHQQHTELQTFSQEQSRRIESLEKELEVAKRRNVDDRDKLAQQLDAFHAMQHSNQNLQNQIIILTTQLNSLKTNNNYLKQDSEQLQNEVYTLQRIRESQIELINSQVQSLEELQERLGRCEKEHSADLALLPVLRARMNQMEIEKKSMIESVVSLSKQLESFKQLVEEYQRMQKRGWKKFREERKEQKQNQTMEEAEEDESYEPHEVLAELEKERQKDRQREQMRETPLAAASPVPEEEGEAVDESEDQISEVATPNSAAVSTSPLTASPAASPASGPVQPPHPSRRPSLAMGSIRRKGRANSTAIDPVALALSQPASPSTPATPSSGRAKSRALAKASTNFASFMRPPPIAAPQQPIAPQPQQTQLPSTTHATPAPPAPAVASSYATLAFKLERCLQEALSKNQTLLEKVHRTEREYSVLSQQDQRRQQETNQLQKQHDSLQRNHAKLQEAYNATEALLEKKSARIIELQEELTNLQLLHDQKTEKLHWTEKELQDVHRSFDQFQESKQNELHRLQRAIDNLERQLTQARKQQDADLQRITDLTMEIAAVASAKDDLSKTKDTLTKQLAALTYSNRDLTMKLVVAERDAAKAKQLDLQNYELNRELQRSQQEIQSLKGEQESLQKSLQSAKEQTIDYRMQLQKLQTKNHNLGLENNKLNQRIENLLQQLNREEYTTAIKTNHLLQQQLSVLHAESITLKEQVAKLETEVTQEHKSLEVQIESYKSLQRDYNSLKARNLRHRQNEEELEKLVSKEKEKNKSLMMELMKERTARATPSASFSMPGGGGPLLSPTSGGSFAAGLLSPSTPLSAASSSADSPAHGPFRRSVSTAGATGMAPGPRVTRASSFSVGSSSYGGAGSHHATPLLSPRSGGLAGIDDAERGRTSEVGGLSEVQLDSAGGEDGLVAEPVDHSMGPFIGWSSSRPDSTASSAPQSAGGAGFNLDLPPLVPTTLDGLAAHLSDAINSPGSSRPMSREEAKRRELERRKEEERRMKRRISKQTHTARRGTTAATAAATVSTASTHPLPNNPTVPEEQQSAEMGKDTSEKVEPDHADGADDNTTTKKPISAARHRTKA